MVLLAAIKAEVAHPLGSGKITGLIKIKEKSVIYIHARI